MMSQDNNDLATDRGALVSVVIPTYNRPSETRRAVRSVVAQSYRPIEVVIVDDASDPPFETDDLKTDGLALTVLRNTQNLGAAASRQRGAAAARGTFLAFLDSDDRWLPDKLAGQMSILFNAGNKALVAVSCGWEIHGGGRRQVARIPLESTDPDDFASGCWFSPGATVTMAKATFEAIGPFDARLRRLEDLEWFLRFALAGGTLRVVPIVAATITTGRRSRLDVVDAASRAIMARFSREAGMSAGRLRRLRAYLELERAVAARNESQWLKMVAALAISFALVPRLGFPLRRWWKEGRSL